MNSFSKSQKSDKDWWNFIKRLKFILESMKTYLLRVQTFEKIINKNQLYIDKTKEIYRLIQPEGYYFYARPRRFGKSLMPSTIKSVYEGKKAL